ncbi:polysaccharide deacetylase family protein [Paenibacillus polygoni]|uniref:Polysaccharide deacetylase family protein n=1 Tax=Paenibacillus polygoni TaxID=3050112 RepID=A0ABY8X8C7_9BACL|nr:polysaccharide deacetylase [Paenibacillus polygoni]WIV19721.1 polysaccharide deacetylase family protein [Paenibacillus polygoni]
MRRIGKQNRWKKFSYTVIAGFIILLAVALQDKGFLSNVVNSQAVYIDNEVGSARIETVSKVVHTGLTKSTVHSSLEQAVHTQPVNSASLTAQKQEADLVQSSSKKATVPAANTAVNKVYLTFDDGPGKYTEAVLDILEQYGVPATFFVLGKQVEVYPELINRMHEKGYVIGNHTYDHKYDKLYGSFPDFWKQIKQTEEAVRRITGERPQLVRAPGGTYGHFDTTYFELMKQAGYVVTDWNVDSGDSLKKDVPAKEIIKNATKSAVSGNRVVLLHDGGSHAETVKALPAIIEYYQAHNYEFRGLNPAEKPVQFQVKKQNSQEKVIQPSKEWINNHITENAALFGTGPSLVIEAGKLVTKLAPGEYQEVEGELLVPLRVLVERYGGTVKWNGTDRYAAVKWAGNEITVDPAQQLLDSIEGRVEMRSGSLWVSLRDLLSAADYKIKSIDRNQAEFIIKAS